MNRNGMISRYLPKGTSLDDMTQDELDETARRTDGTPLKVLGWLTRPRHGTSRWNDSPPKTHPSPGTPYNQPQPTTPGVSHSKLE